MNKLYNKKIIIIVGIAVFVMLLLILNYNKNKSNDDIIIEATEKIIKEEPVKEKYIIVHITGCVRNQGIIEVKENSRIADVIELAGGTTEEADISKVNLAYIVKDAQKIYIPSIYDEKQVEYISNESGDNVIIEENIKGESKMININSSTQTELEQLPGIGPSTAIKIINYREQNGKFKSIEDLKEVPGIGESKFENIKNMIEV